MPLGFQEQGIGRALLDALIDSSEEAGTCTLQSSVFPETAASIARPAARGFRELDRRERVAQHGRWRDTVLMERRGARVGTA